MARCSSRFDGGGLYVTAATASITRSSITGNGADLGAGVYVGSFASVAVTGSSIDTNVASFLGGGVYIHRLGGLAVSRSGIVANAAKSDGGGVFVTDSTGVTLTTSVVARNTAVGRGGGILVQQRSTLELAQSVVHGNQAGSGGGVLVASNSRVTVNASWVAFNRARVSGGGVSVEGDQTSSATAIVLSACPITDNSAAASGGTCGCAQGMSRPPATDTHKTRVCAAHAHTLRWHAGGIYMSDACGTNVTHCMVRANTAVSGAGLAAGIHAAVQVSSCAWILNVAKEDGGAMSFRGIPGTSADSIATAAGVWWSNIAVTTNAAIVGGGAYWGLPLPYSQRATPLPTSSCPQCVWQRNTGGDVSTSAVRVALYPEHGAITSISVASGMRIADYVPVRSMRPRAAVLDALGQPTRLDNVTVCSVELSDATDATATLAPLFVQSQVGILRYDDLVFRAAAESTMDLVTRCALESPLGGRLLAFTRVATRIQPCLPGWDLTSDRVCRRCLPGAYSPVGRFCKPCPAAGDCEDTLGEAGQEVRVVAALVRSPLPSTNLSHPRRDLMPCRCWLGLCFRGSSPVTG